MSMKATSVRLDDETLDRVGRMAEAMDRPRAWLMAHAIKKFVEQEEFQALVNSQSKVHPS
jgi:predicted transcriptional regulator